MNIRFHDTYISKLCLNPRFAQKELGFDVANKLQKALQFIDSSLNLYDVKKMPSFHFHSLQGKRSGQYAIDLGRKLGFRLILIPLDEYEKMWPQGIDENEMCKSTTMVILMEVSKHYE